MGNCFKKRFKNVPVGPSIKNNTIEEKEDNLSLREIKQDFSYQNIYILVIEDNVVLIEMLKHQLRKIGYTVLISKDFNKAMDIISRWALHTHIINRKLLVLLDNDLGDKRGMTGSKFCSFISRYDNVQIIGMSSNDLRHKFIEAGAVSFIQKPFSVNDLKKIFGNL